MNRYLKFEHFVGGGIHNVTDLEEDQENNFTWSSSMYDRVLKTTIQPDELYVGEAGQLGAGRGAQAGRKGRGARQGQGLSRLTKPLSAT